MSRQILFFLLSFALLLSTWPQDLSAFQDAPDPGKPFKIRPDLPVCLFSARDGPVGQQLEGLLALIDRYRKAGLRDISRDCYEGGRHEILNVVIREEVRKNLLAWLSALL
ncbi:MAG TPA: hypothetical protein VMP68_12145 [Candidatus Eisenbacteria bacterium]|nr:hypothetical protein [Candidatus Eisenbacteria bacterium]